MNIITIYAEMEPARKPYLDEADEVARISLPDLHVLGQGCASRSSHDADLRATSRPYSNSPAHAIGRLSTSLQALILPPSINWFMLDLPVDVKLTLEVAETAGTVQPGLVVGIQAIARKAETLVLSKMAEHDLYGKSGDAIRRLLVEGQVLFHVTSDFVRVIPLRSFCVSRFNGNVEKIVIKEKYNREGEEYDLYTLVDYTTGKVHQQRSTQETATVIDAKPKQYFVASSAVKDYEDYASSFAVIHHPTIYSINFLSKKIQEIAYWAALNIICLDPSFPMTVQELKEKLEKGDNIFAAPPLPDGRMGGIGFFSAQAKLADLAALTNELRRQEAMLAQAFALGITAQGNSIEGRERVTAQEIYARSTEVDADAQSHASTLMSTFQRPIVEAYLEVLGVQLPLPDGRDTIRPVILAGANLLSRMVKANQLISTVDAIVARNPEYVRRINYDEVFMEVAQSQGLQNPERFLLPPEQQPPMAPPGGPPQ